MARERFRGALPLFNRGGNHIINIFLYLDSVWVLSGLL